MNLWTAMRHAITALLFFSMGTAITVEAQNGFDTAGGLISRGHIRGGGPPKDGIPALTNPAFESPAQVDYLRDDDLVVGISINGESKAYPLRILVWHEIANDRIGGMPVLITYCPLCRSTLVFGRRIGGKALEFGVSGLLYNSNVLMYDRQPGLRKESLWSQAEMRAVTGPAAKEGRRLKLLPSELTTWADWLKRHPTTRVLSIETGHLRSYRGQAYASYFSNDRLMFPVREKTKRPREFRKKELLAVVYTKDGARAYAVRDIAEQARERGFVEDRLGSRTLRLTPVDSGKSVRVEAADAAPDPAVAYMFWFALSAMQPQVEIYDH